MFPPWLTGFDGLSVYWIYVLLVPYYVILLHYRPTLVTPFRSTTTPDSDDHRNSAIT